MMYDVPSPQNSPMKGRWRRAAIVCGVVLIVAGAVGYRLWRHGTPYQPPRFSPNGRYYVQKFSNVTLPRLLPAMAGQGGSDRIDGYIRLYDKDGRMIHERFEHFIRDVEPLWTDRRVFLRGVAAMDDDPWILPSPAD
jgi:hypothetical protein